jgi:hypothetical protein
MARSAQHLSQYTSDRPLILVNFLFSLFFLLPQLRLLNFRLSYIRRLIHFFPLTFSGSIISRLAQISSLYSTFLRRFPSLILCSYYPPPLSSCYPIFVIHHLLSLPTHSFVFFLISILPPCPFNQ